MACSISGVKEKSDGPEEEGAKTGSWASDGAEVAGVEEIGADVEGVDVVVGNSEDGRVSDFFPLAFLGPLKVTVGTSRFQQFFFTYAKLMAGLRLSSDLESEVTPLALQKAVIKAGNPDLEESC